MVVSLARNSPPSSRVFAFDCRRFVIIATDSQPPCCISSFLPPRSPLFRRHLPPLPFSLSFSHLRPFFLSPSGRCSLSAASAAAAAAAAASLLIHLSYLSLCRPSPGASALPFRRRPSFSSREHLLFTSAPLPRDASRLPSVPRPPLSTRPPLIYTPGATPSSSRTHGFSPTRSVLLGRARARARLCASDARPYERVRHADTRAPRRGSSLSVAPPAR